MRNRSPRGGPNAGGGLENWLILTIQRESLRGFPPYYPLGDRVGRQPDQYARALLASLRNHEEGTLDRERMRDDGRAFRSWAESQPMTAGEADRVRSAC
jgi:hypothetical protein